MSKNIYKETLTFSTVKDPPKPNDNSEYAKFYNKHNFGLIFESYLLWGPEKIEISGCLSPQKRKFVAESMYYLNKEGDPRGEHEKAPRDHLELLCKVFKIPIKCHKNNK